MNGARKSSDSGQPCLLELPPRHLVPDHANSFCTSAADSPSLASICKKFVPNFLRTGGEGMDGRCTQIQE